MLDSMKSIIAVLCILVLTAGIMLYLEIGKSTKGKMCLLCGYVTNNEVLLYFIPGSEISTYRRDDNNWHSCLKSPEHIMVDENDPDHSMNRHPHRIIPRLPKADQQMYIEEYFHLIKSGHGKGYEVMRRYNEIGNKYNIRIIVE